MIRKEIVFSREYLFLFRYAHKLFENEHMVLIKLSKTQGGNLAYLLPIKIGNMESLDQIILLFKRSRYANYSK